MPNTTAPRPTGTARYSGLFKDMVNGVTKIYDDGQLAHTFSATASQAGAGTATLPATVTIGGIAYNFPPDNGDAGEQLETDGAGGLTWEAAT